MGEVRAKQGVRASELERAPQGAPRAARLAYRLTVAGVALAAVVAVLGAYTRLVDAGLGCPDWPGCYGGFGAPASAAEVARAEAAYPDAPVETAKAWTEMVHRYAATALGVLILAILAATLRAGLPWRLPLALVALVVAQGAFGAWTVTLKLWPQVVTAHLLGGFATLALLWLLASSMRPPSWRPSRRVRGPAALALGAVVAQVALGGWLTANYAGLACPDFPKCHGAWIPEMNIGEGFDIAQTVGPNYLGGLLSGDARVAIHLVHRIGAVVLLGGFGWSAALLIYVALAALMVPCLVGMRGHHAPPEGEAQTLREALAEARAHGGFWLLCGGFFVCGFHVYFIATHLPPFLTDAGLSPMLGATALGVIGLGNVVGTFAAGWLGGRHRKKHVLSLFYLARALVIGGFVVAPLNETSVLVFAALIGLLWLGTVPLTSGLVAQIFGPRYLGALFGIVFLSHQVGAFLGAWLGGFVFDLTGAYDAVWLTACGLGVLAAVLHWPIADAPLARPARPAAPA